MAQFPGLEVRNDSSTSQEARIQFRLYNRGGAGDDVVDPENYRITLLKVADSRSDEIVTDIEDGFELLGGLGSGSCGFFPSTPVGYESTTYPPYLGSDTPADDFTFTYMLRFRFDAKSGLTTLGAGQGIGGMRLRIRRGDFKIYSKVDNNFGAAYIYTLGWSWAGLTGTYAPPLHIGLEYNDTDPTNENSTNWQLVSIYDASKVLETNQPYYPYGATSLSTRLPTITDHAYLPVNGDAYIDENLSTTNFGTGNELSANTNFWNGSATTNRKVLQKFDWGSIDPATVKDGVLLNHTYAGIVYPAGTGNVFSVEEVDNAWGETTVTWDTEPTSTPRAQFQCFSNSDDSNFRSWTVRFPRLTTDYDKIKANGLKWAYTNTTDYRVWRVYSREAGFATTPGLLVRLSGSTPPVGQKMRFMVW